MKPHLKLIFKILFFSSQGFLVFKKQEKNISATKYLIKYLLNEKILQRICLGLKKICIKNENHVLSD